MEKKQKFSIGYFLIAFLVVMAIQNFFVTPHAENITYSEFKALLKVARFKTLPSAGARNHRHAQTGRARGGCCTRKSAMSSSGLAQMSIALSRCAWMATEHRQCPRSG